MSNLPSTSVLIPTFNGQIGDTPQLLVNARDLHAFLEVGRDFSNRIKLVFLIMIFKKIKIIMGGNHAVMAATIKGVRQIGLIIGCIITPIINNAIISPKTLNVLKIRLIHVARHCPVINGLSVP